MVRLLIAKCVTTMPTNHGADVAPLTRALSEVILPDLDSQVAVLDGFHVSQLW